MFQVARATGRSTMAVARAPYVETLWEYTLLLEAEHIASITREGERLDAAGLATYAFHKPSELRQAELRFKKAAGLLRSRSEVIAQASALVAGFANATLMPSSASAPAPAPAPVSISAPGEA